MSDQSAGFDFEKDERDEALAQENVAQPDQQAALADEPPQDSFSSLLKVVIPDGLVEFPLKTIVQPITLDESRYSEPGAAVVISNTQQDQPVLSVAPVYQKLHEKLAHLKQHPDPFLNEQQAKQKMREVWSPYLSDVCFQCIPYYDNRSISSDSVLTKVCVDLGCYSSHIFARLIDGKTRLYRTSAIEYYGPLIFMTILKKQHFKKTASDLISIVEKRIKDPEKNMPFKTLSSDYEKLITHINSLTLSIYKALDGEGKYSLPSELKIALKGSEFLFDDHAIRHWTFENKALSFLIACIQSSKLEDKGLTDFVVSLMASIQTGYQDKKPPTSTAAKNHAEILNAYWYALRLEGTTQIRQVCPIDFFLLKNEMD